MKYYNLYFSTFPLDCSVSDEEEADFIVESLSSQVLHSECSPGFLPQLPSDWTLWLDLLEELDDHGSDCLRYLLANNFRIAIEDECVVTLYQYPFELSIVDIDEYEYAPKFIESVEGDDYNSCVIYLWQLCSASLN